MANGELSKTIQEAQVELQAELQSTLDALDINGTASTDLQKKRALLNEKQIALNNAIRAIDSFGEAVKKEAGGK